MLCTERFYRDAEGHRVRRSGWTCIECRRPWPYLTARLLIRHRIRDAYDLVRIATVGKLRVADTEVGEHSGHKLYRQFTVWTHRNLVCGVCGSDRHVALPGVPPRLYRCDGFRTLVAGGAP
ncbi:hypothetical protein [Dactylosporangium sp. CA-139066]|uniref:hypothetical protein n=1 Tax=Dactylosporangium sp. CA-139066 TaxID=3239930 RepID=UPI003D8F03A7